MGVGEFMPSVDIGIKYLKEDLADILRHKNESLVAFPKTHPYHWF